MDIGLVTAESIKKALGNTSKAYYKRRIIEPVENNDSNEAEEVEKKGEIDNNNEISNAQQMEIKRKRYSVGLPLK